MSTRIIKSFYADGTCLGNPGPGGWGLVVSFTDGSIVELGGAQEQTTSNCMEMQAAVAALQLLSATAQSEPVTLYINSEYLRTGVTKGLSGWKQSEWKTDGGEPILHRELWETLDRLNSDRIDWQYGYEQSNKPSNEYADADSTESAARIARAFAGGVGSQHPFSDFETALQDLEWLQRPHREKVAGLSDSEAQVTIGYKQHPHPTTPHKKMTEFAPTSATDDSLLSQEQRIAQLRHSIESLRIADEIASKGYLIGSSELADLMNVNASAVTSRGDHWPWRNWVVSRVRREGNQILWQLERVD
ncbi:ribonuclease H [Oscillatoria sp. FACHB-1406]|uniref:ribonuclease H family protein n=1 Tax=Oscillatoria sp. FACHB-1406 TaxID=2692846 RepID=UPI0016838DB3|nr:ribonuclease H [Oscillatoria sp. FACHB-1406]MBD2576584.1 ribonuclease HI [Oscillatoria sp. FACHB-1406]